MTQQDAQYADEAAANAPSEPTSSKAMYTLCYYLAFGATYAGHLAMELVPADSIVRHGLQDGADAARQAWAQSREEDRIAESEMALPPEQEMVRS